MEIMSRRDPVELEGDVFEVLETLGDFESFKELMISHKNLMNGQHLDFSDLITIYNNE